MEDEDEPVIIRMLENMFARKLEIYRQKEMASNIDDKAIRQEIKLNLLKQVAKKFERKLEADWVHVRTKLEHLVDKIVNAKE